MLPSLKYGDIELSNFCRTSSYIDSGLAGECWKRCESRKNCCCGEPSNEDAEGCGPCTVVSGLIAGNGSFTLTGGGVATVTDLTTSPFTGSPNAGCGTVLDAGSWGIVGSSGFGSNPSFTISFSEPISGIRFYIGNINAEEGAVLSPAASCVTPGVNCDGVTFTTSGFIADATHTVSSHIVDYTWDEPISSLTFDHNELGLGHLIRFEILDCITEYIDPATDQAPWYSADEPCSEQYFGLFIETVKYGNAYTAKVEDTLYGGFVQTRNLKARELTVRGWLVGSSECGVQYGLDWLNATLDPRKCASECTSPDLEVYVCCDLTDEGKGRRTLKKVSPITPVRELTPDADYRCCRTQVEFKLAAESPYFFRDPVDFAADVPFSTESCPNWCCPSCTDNVIAPECLTEEFQTVNLPLGQSEGSCYCEPLFAFNACVEVPAGGTLTDFVNWELTAGDDLVNVSVVFVEQPADATGSPIDDPGAYACQLQSKASAAYIPAGHTLSFDSSSGEVTLLDPDRAPKPSYGIGGPGPIQLGCQPGWLCAYADSCNDIAGSGLSAFTVTGSL